ncbi:MAG: M23 family metallopeptidase [Peptococcaceae bacterium]|nr:M23 family metallopeptidase [Peptococcaceae bacterium]
MANTGKIAAVILTCLIFSGILAVSATATPDEWIAEEGPYLDPSVKNIDSEGGGAASSAETGRYVVQKGDTLLAIAGKLGVPAAELASMNNLRDADRIREGQLLLIPGGVVVHTVQPGETLSAIARKFGTTWKDIAAANGIENEDLVVAGRKLVICRGSGPAAVPAAPASRGLPVGELEWPVVGWISSPFGTREGKPHEGIDIAADYGVPIRAAMAGRVAFAGPRGTYGLAVILDHGDGLITLYAHSSKILVSEGEWVDRGQVIALVGNTGNSRGPHLHLELRINDIPYDPMLCLRRAYA